MKAKISWFAVSGNERFPLKRNMTLFGYDATCTCGWDSRTGGANRNTILRAIKSHKLDHEVGLINREAS